MTLLLEPLTARILEAAFEVANDLGPGFLESIYEAARGLAPEHSAQTLNYLKATGMPVAMLLNFGTPRIEVRRFDNHFKKMELTGMEGMEGIKNETTQPPLTASAPAISI